MSIGPRCRPAAAVAGGAVDRRRRSQSSSTLLLGLAAALLVLLLLPPGAEGLGWPGKKDNKGREQSDASAACPALPSLQHSTTTSAASAPLPLIAPKSTQPQAYAEDYLVPLLPSPGGGDGDGDGLPPGPFSAARVLSVAPRKGSRSSPAVPVNLVAVAREGAHDSGEGGALLHIYDLYGSLLATHATGHAAPVTCIAFDGGGGGGDARLLLLTGARDGSVHLHEGTLWRHGAIIAGGGGRAGAPGASGFGPAVWGLDGYGVELRLSRRLQPPSTGGAGTEVLSGLLNHYQARQQLGWVAATGDAGGRLRFHAPNGTLVKELDTGAPVHGLARHGAKHLAITSGPDVRFLSPATLQEPAHHSLVCLGRHGPLVSLAVDPALPFLLYAGTSDGDILAFDSRGTAPSTTTVAAVAAIGGAGVGGRSRGQKQLALAFKLGHPRHGGPNNPVALTALPGYLLAATSTGLFAYNTTALRFGGTDGSGDSSSGGGPPPLVFHLPLSGGSHSSSATAKPPVLAASVARPPAGPGPGGSGKPPPPPPPIFLLQGPGGRLRVWESLLPYARPKPIDLFLVRIPLMLVALGLVLFWHWQKQSHQQTAALLGAGKRAGFVGGGLFGSGAGGAGGRRRWRGRYRGDEQETIYEEEEGEEDAEEEDDMDPIRNIGLRPPGRRGYEVAGDAFDGEEEAEETFMRRALQEVLQAGPGARSAMEEAELEEVLRRERARIERWR